MVLLIALEVLRYENIKVSLLQYADDTVLFFGWIWKKFKKCS